MAGRFLSLEEAAQKLGVSADDVQRLVDRKILYPIRDGSGLKFKTDDLDQYMLERQENAGTSDDLAAQPEALAAMEAAPLELDSDAADSLTLDVEAMIELEPASGIEAEPASVVAVDVPQSAIELTDEPASVVAGGQTSDIGFALDLDAPSEAAARRTEATPAPMIGVASAAAEGDSLVLLEPDDPAGDDLAASVISGLSAPMIKTGGADSGAEVLLADSGRLSLDRDDLELDSIIAASSPGLPAANLPDEAGAFAIDLGEPILGDPLAGSAINASGGSLVVGTDDDLLIGSNAPSGKVGSALSDVLDSGVLIEEKAVELEGIQTWDEVELGIEDDVEDQPGSPLGDEPIGGNFDDDDFDLGRQDENSSVALAADASEASDLFPSDIDPSGLSGQSFGGSVGISGSLEFPGEMVADIRFSTWQICGLICCSLILLTGGLVAFDLVRTIGTSQGTVLANPLLNALAETFGWR